MPVRREIPYNKGLLFLPRVLIAGSAIEKIPTNKLSKQAIDTYVGRGSGAIKDGYFDNRSQTVEESDKLDLKIEQKKK